MAQVVVFFFNLREEKIEKYSNTKKFCKHFNLFYGWVVYF